MRWCPSCSKKRVYFDGQGYKKGEGKYICSKCGKKFTKDQMWEVNNLKENYSYLIWRKNELRS